MVLVWVGGGERFEEGLQGLMGACRDVYEDIGEGEGEVAVD